MMKQARLRNPCPTSEDARKGREKALPSGRAWQVRQSTRVTPKCFPPSSGPLIRVKEGEE